MIGRIDREKLTKESKREIYEMIREYCRETGASITITGRHKAGWDEILEITGDKVMAIIGRYDPTEATDRLIDQVLDKVKEDDLWKHLEGTFKDLERYYTLSDFADQDILALRDAMEMLDGKAIGSRITRSFRDSDGNLHSMTFKKVADDFRHPEDNITVLLDGKKISTAVVMKIFAAAEDLDAMEEQMERLKALRDTIKHFAIRMGARAMVAAAQEVRKGLTLSVGNHSR